MSVWPGVADRRLVHQRNRHVRRETPGPQAALHGRRPRLRQEALGTRAGRDAGPRRRQHHGEHHGLRLEGAPGREDLSRSQDARGHGSEGLRVRAARDGDPGRPAVQDPQLRRHPPQRPHASQGQQGVQPGDAGDAQGSDHAVRQGRGDLPHQVRRPPVDERLRRGLQPSVLLGDGRRTASSRSRASTRAPTRSPPGTSGWGRRRPRSRLAANDKKTQDFKFALPAK